MPADGFPFTVRVSCQIDFIGSLRLFFQFAQQIAFAADGNILGFEIVFNVNAHLAFGQIADMPHGSLNFIIASQKFSNGTCLCRRFYNDKVFL